MPNCIFLIPILFVDVHSFFRFQHEFPSLFQLSNLLRIALNHKISNVLKAKEPENNVIAETQWRMRIKMPKCFEYTSSVHIDDEKQKWIAIP